jgi:hypothetical protein
MLSASVWLFCCRKDDKWVSRLKEFEPANRKNLPAESKETL